MKTTNIGTIVDIENEIGDEVIYYHGNEYDLNVLVTNQSESTYNEVIIANTRDNLDFSKSYWKKLSIFLKTENSINICSTMM